MSSVAEADLEIRWQNTMSSRKAWFATAVLDHVAADETCFEPRPRFATVLPICKVNGLDLWLGQPTCSTWSAPFAHVKFAPVGNSRERRGGPMFLLATSIDDDLGGRRVIKKITITSLKEVLSETTITHLSLRLESALNSPTRADRSFVEFACSTIRAFIASRLTVSATVKTRGGGLAPWQQRRATELLLSGIGRHVSVADLASACGLSESHFVRAFRQSTGLPPHQWVLARRIERSKELLSISPSQSLSEVAVACGFADQSHFTRTFSRMAGLTPGAWRRFAAASRGSDAKVAMKGDARAYVRGLLRCSVSPPPGLGEGA